MVSYGPWRQDPDFEQSSTYTEDATFDNRYLGDDGGGGWTDNGWSASGYQVTQGDLEAAFLGAMEGHDEVPDFGIDHGVEYGYGQQARVVPEEYLANWGALYMRAKWRIAPDVSGYSYWPPNYGHFDPDAVAIQYEGFAPVPVSLSGAASIVGVALDGLTQIITRVGDSTDTGGEVDEGLSDPWDTKIMVRPLGYEGDPVIAHAIAGFGSPTWPNALTTTLGADLDLTNLLGEFGWSGDVWTDTPIFVTPRYMPETGEEVASGDVKYGWLLKAPQVTYLVRPPRYRWVYESDPYRRIFPRDDALGAGSNRTFPPSKAIQSSNRTSGSYL